MQYVLLITNGPISDLSVSNAEAQSFIRVDFNGLDLSDWAEEPERLVRIHALGKQPHVYVVHYKDVVQLRAALLHLSTEAPCLIDDDFDLFVDNLEFAALCRQHPETNQWWLGQMYP